MKHEEENPLVCVKTEATSISQKSPLAVFVVLALSSPVLIQQSQSQLCIVSTIAKQASHILWMFSGSSTGRNNRSTGIPTSAISNHSPR